MRTQQAGTEVVAALSARAREVSVETLRKGLASPHASFRQLAVEQLADRRAMQVEDIETLLTDASGLVREATIIGGLEGGSRISVESLERALSDFPTALDSYDIQARMRLAFFRTLDAEELQRRVDWLSTSGVVAYHALALDHFDLVGDTVRADLSTDFQRIRDETEVPFANGTRPGRCSTHHADLGRKGSGQLHPTGVWPCGAFGLAVNGAESDAELARQALETAEYSDRDAAISVLARFGTPEDVGALLAIARDSYGDTKEMAGNAALSIAPGIDGAARLLIDSGDSDLLRLAVESLDQEDPHLVSNILEARLLLSETDAIRKEAVRYFIHKFSPDELETMLDEYVGRSRYFYNVVCWCDRLLYAPELFRRSYDEMLESRIG